MPTRSYLVAALALLVAIHGCGESSTPDPLSHGRVLVLSAFPAEIAPLLEQASIEQTVQVEGRWFRVGTLGSMPVVIGMTGIGIANAAQASRVAFDAFDVVGAVFSGVAGSFLRIGDVAVPLTWELADGMRFASDPEWIELARELTPPGTVALDGCTLLPSDPDRGPVCLTEPTAIVVGGHGVSKGFEEHLVACQPGAGDVFGCDTPSDVGEGQSDDNAVQEAATVAAEPLASEDMESAAVAREAAARGLRFIAFRAVSDGAGDPLNLPGFPAQFFAYYRLAGRNAAAATRAFLERLATYDRLRD